jgi:hypothetical protein
MGNKHSNPFPTSAILRQPRVTDRSGPKLAGGSTSPQPATSRIISCGEMTLPIPAEIDARFVSHRKCQDAINLDAVRIAPMILAPGAFLREPGEVRAG